LNDLPRLLRLLGSGAAHFVDKHIGFSRHLPKNTVPKIRISQEAIGNSPAAWFICPDYNRPSGGIRKLYRSVDLLNEAGFRAAIIHKRPGFRCTWFSHQTQVINSNRAFVSYRDVLVVPEIYGSSISDLPRGVRKVIFNQNTFLMLDSLISEQEAAVPYLNDPDLSVVLVVSEDNARVMNYIFPGVRVRHIRPGLDHALFHPPADAKLRQIAYMPRKRAREATEILTILKLRGILDGWKIVAIDGRTEAEVADILRTTRIFLSFNKREGFGLPALEALACGCFVAGYHGFGGRELFRLPFAIAIEDGDVVGFAQAVEKVIRLVDDDPAGIAAASTAGVRFVHDHYSLDHERQDLLDAFSPLLRQ
jgi:glycosyltransferase involved in cell wall biosynthesis